MGNQSEPVVVNHVRRSLALLLGLAMLTSCQPNSEPRDQSNTSVEALSESSEPRPQVAEMDTSSPENMPSQHYVLASNGLNLRRSADASSEILATLPYRSRVFLPGGKTGSKMVVDHLKGHMVPAQKDTLEGFLFSGYLSVAAPPAVYKDGGKWDYISDYAELLGPEMTTLTISESDEGGKLLEFSIKGIDLQEAFLIGKKLFFIPEAYLLPLKDKVVLSTPENPSKAVEDGPYSEVTQEFSWVESEDSQHKVLMYQDDSEAGGRKITWKKLEDKVLIKLESWVH